MTEHVLCLRTCDSTMRSHGGFTWPKKGAVSCDDWSPKPACGNGLHGLLWGAGHAGLLNLSDEAKWLAVKVLASEVVAIDYDKVKFPRGEVVFCGARDRAVAYVQKRAPAGSVVVFGKYPGRYELVDVAGVKAVKDNLTGLTWDAEGSSDWLSYARAEAYCSALGAGWRMPIIQELRTLVEYQRTSGHLINKLFTCHGWYYRSSTPYAPGPACRWGVGFVDGGSSGLDGGNVCPVRAVRASQ